ncbi:phosphatidylinositol glycan anchor biosynthesis class M [Brevipalpus obovatus]|uniref:phosphatidylinositol glycan anchor biosynthesis class M n=1 Tax=Brevipalpus obovatus TaxID=246614 RepID=UPI003D9F7A01
MIVEFIEFFSLRAHLIFGYLVRVFSILWGLIQDQIFHLPYTDIDYTVFTDGARYMKSGRSPYLRHGYRYSPVFAALSLPNVLLFNEIGKFLFSAFDIANGHLIYKIVAHPLIGCDHRTALMMASLWIYNPLSIVVSTRGSSDSVITFLVLYACHELLNENYFRSGLLLGTAIHCKLYPIIYTLPIYLYLGGKLTSVASINALSPFTRRRLIFLFSVFLSFASLTYLSYIRYGQMYLNEAWLYHISRRDTAHNFSPYFYIYRTIKTSDETALRVVSLFSFVPQFLTIIYLSVRYCVCKDPHKSAIQLMFCLFTSTYIFVTFNKVVTSQYFLWYFSFLPIVTPFLGRLYHRYHEALKLFALWIFGQFQWLLVAYFYQYRRWNCLEILAGCSFLFLLINLIIYGRIVRSFVPIKDRRD